MPPEMIFAILLLWTVVLVWQSARLFALAKELERQRAEVRRWIRRAQTPDQQRL